MTSIIGYSWFDLLIFILLTFNAVTVQALKPINNSEVFDYTSGYV